ncbi:GDSL esterase/lipase At2g40250-like [Medicago truncatula]|uniref:GDSL esterase/lipase At2g40250-like n=1 Tax=Medicago truncatula TaxID=3880 RepID=UPI00196767F6|nr:GDSL esterase/lipase At2g40250-like [Medicago truncatula]
MASKTASSFLYLSLLLSISMPNSATAFNKTPAIFAFGDSTIDAGNNNHIDTTMRCDHLPYGRDLPNQIPTGRFTNGKLPTDYLSQRLGIKDLLPAFLDPQVTDNDLLTGVSFGSGGSGLDSQTVALAKVLDLGTQFQLFEQALLRIRKIVGNEKANDIIQNAFFAISIGTNDMLYNVYMTQNTPHGSASSYQDFLLQNLQNFFEVGILFYILDI